MRAFLAEFHGNPSFYSGESALRTLFSIFPENTRYDEVLLKVVALNRLYSTNVWAVWDMATHTVDSAVDPGIRAGAPETVRTIARLQIGPKQRCFYSFATKYCSWHNPDAFPIYDNLVDRALWHFRKRWAFAEFRRSDLGYYEKFVAIHDAFSRHFGLTEFSRKQLDKFLWIYGKRYLSGSSAGGA